MKRFLVMSLIILVLSVLIFGSCAQPAPAPAPAPTPAPGLAPPLKEDRSKWPKAISIGTAGIGSSVYMQGAVLATLITKYLGIPATPEVLGGSARYAAIWKGEAEFALGSEDNVSWAVYGVVAKDWLGKHMPIRAMIPADTGTRAIVVATNSKIQTISDLKGKKYCWPSYSETSNLCTDYLLGVGGLTLKDVVQKPLESSTAGMAALIEGAVDAWMVVMGSPGGPAAETLQADTAIGIRALPITEEEAKAIEQASNLWYHPIRLPAGYLTGNKAPFWAISFRRMAACFRDAPDDFIYAVTKVFWGNIGEARKMLVDFEGYKLPDGLQNSAAPYHPGAIRYYKEIGVWTDAMEKVNQKHLQNIGEAR